MKRVYLFAMYDECKYSIKDLGYNLINEEPFKIYSNESSLIAISGVGISRAAACVAYITMKYNIQEIINIGLVGSVDPNIKVLDQFWIEKAYFSSVDLTGFGYEYGQHSLSEKFFKPNIGIKTNLIKANIATSDIFINDINKKELFIEKIKDDIHLVDMECASIFMIADIFKLKYCAIKVVSDNIYLSDKNENQFNKIIEQSGPIISNIITKTYKGIEV